MKRKTVVILGVIGLFLAGLLIAFAVVMIPRWLSRSASDAQGTGMHRGPGMMGGGGMMGGNSTPGGLAAVSPDGEKLPLDASAANELPEGTVVQKVSGLNVALTLNPYPPVSMQPASFEVVLTDENGQPVSDAQVTLNLTMPSMWMPENKPEAAYVADGRYQADGRFTMRGGWRIEVIITRGGEKLSAFFDVGL
jgi:hypothetical protein